MRLIDVDALKAESSMGSDCNECKRNWKKCQYDRVYSLQDICGWLDDAPTVFHWIPVTERLPEKFGYCIVSGGNSVWFARFENGDFNGILSGRALDSVIAWMPLPEPWKGSGSE